MSDKTMEQATWQEVIYQLDQVVMDAGTRYKILVAIKEWGLEVKQIGMEKALEWIKIKEQ